MRKFLRILALGAMLACRPAVAQEKGIAIVGADVLPMTGTAELRDQTVLVAGGRITEVGARAKVRVPAGYRTIQAAGMTLMPGLVDMHVHVSNDYAEPGSPARRALAVMLGHGVTTARGMVGAPNHPALRGAIERGEVTGPRFYAGSPIFHVTSIANPEAARQGVAGAKQAGFDFIKLVRLPDLETWQAVQDEARRLGLPVAGHVPNAIGLDRAVATGQQIEHLDSVAYGFLPEDSPEKKIEFVQIPEPVQLRILSGVRDDQLDALAARLKASNSYQVPTLALFEKMADFSRTADAAAADPEMRFIPEPAIKQWSGQYNGLKEAGFSQADGDAFRDFRRRVVRAYHRAGVPIMAGSDTAQYFHIWGPGLIAELESLVAAGLTPMDALRSATVVPRDYFRSLANGGSALGWRADFGTVERGARADLILLAGNPARDLSALRSLRLVIAGGRLHDRAALDALLDGAAEAARAAGTPAAKPAQ